MKTLIIIGAVVLVIGCVFLSAWITMLLLGALAHATGWQIAVSYWAALLINLIIGGFRGVGHHKK